MVYPVISIAPAYPSLPFIFFVLRVVLKLAQEWSLMGMLRSLTKKTLALQKITLSFPQKKAKGDKQE